jgi:hypothetical protein
MNASDSLDVLNKVPMQETQIGTQASAMKFRMT